jgi:hypothetical protein
MGIRSMFSGVSGLQSTARGLTSSGNNLKHQHGGLQGQPRSVRDPDQPAHGLRQRRQRRERPWGRERLADRVGHPGSVHPDLVHPRQDLNTGINTDV